jgi:hypothetical protein
MTLARLAPLRLLGVGNGERCQAFLKAAGTTDNPLAGMIIVGPDGFAYVTRTPALSLPIINPFADGAYPATPTWTTFLVSQPGGDEQPWQMLKAPSAGKWLPEADGGLFHFVDSTTVNNGASVCTTDGQVEKIAMFGCANIGTNDAPSWALRKLQPVNKKVVVGIVPLDGSFSGFRVLPDAEELSHPKIRATTQFIGAQIVMLDPSLSTPFPDGIGSTVSFGVGAITDLKTMVYSPTTQQMHFRPAPIYKNYRNNVPIVASMGDWNTSYAEFIGSHAVAPAVDIHYPNVIVSAYVLLKDARSLDWALFRDGSLLTASEINTDTGSTTNRMSIFHVDENVPPGSHQYSLRVKKAGSPPGSPAGTTIMSSRICIVTLPA